MDSPNGWSGEEAICGETSNLRVDGLAVCCIAASCGVVDIVDVDGMDIEGAVVSLSNTP